MDGLQIRNFRDFLLLYNQVSETCFKRCMHTFFSREISSDEERCIQTCAEKYVHTNHKIMQVYIEVQPIIMRKRMEENDKIQAKIQAQMQQEQAIDTTAQVV